VTAAELSVTEVEAMDPCCASGYRTAIATASSDYPHCWQCKLSSKRSPSAVTRYASPAPDRPMRRDLGRCEVADNVARASATFDELATFFVEPWTQASNPLNRSGRWSYGISDLPQGTVIEVKELSS